MKKFKETIEKCKVKFNNFYNYDSVVEPKYSKDKVCIICPVHGEFWQSLDNHLHGHGCPKCKFDESKKRLKYTKEEFVKKANKVHGNKYDYSKFVYNGSEKKSIIICPVHGEFLQTPYVHLNGCGCKRCSHKLDDEKKERRKDKMLQLCKDSKHGADVDFSKWVYNGFGEKSVFICPKHGEFSVKVGKFIGGQGCPECSKEKMNNIFRSNTEEFIEKATEKYGDRYSYDETVYEKSNKKVKIFCNDCGKSFFMTPNHFLNGEECKCHSASKMEREIERLLSKNKIEYEREYVFEGLKNRKYDFFIPSKGIIIECQGEQHFRPVDFGGLNDEKSLRKEFDSILKRDNEKYEFAKNNYQYLFYVNKKYFKDKKINIFENWYFDKELFINKEKLIKRILVDNE